MDGYIKLYRQMTEWEWYKNIPVRVLFEHCLLKANYKTNKWQGMTISKGSFATSYGNLAYETGLTIKQVRNALEKLKTTNELAHEGHSQFSIITIKNWDKFQDEGKQEGKQRASEGQAKGKRRATTKKDNKEKNIIYDQFLEFYEAYPKKRSKSTAQKAFEKAITKTSFENIMDGLTAYKKEISKKQTEEKYIKYPATWLNQECWDDDYSYKPKEEKPYVYNPYL